MDKQYRIGGIGRGQLPISGSVKRWQILTSGLGDDAELVIGYHLEQRLSQQPQPLDLFRRRTAILGLVVLPQGVDSLLNQRLAGLNHAKEGALFHCTAPLIDQRLICLNRYSGTAIAFYLELEPTE